VIEFAHSLAELATLGQELVATRHIFKLCLKIGDLGLKVGDFERACSYSATVSAHSIKGRFSGRLGSVMAQSLLAAL
jgi:hypothetical protein